MANSHHQKNPEDGNGEASECLQGLVLLALLLGLWLTGSILFLVVDFLNNILSLCRILFIVVCSRGIVLHRYQGPLERSYKNQNEDNNTGNDVVKERISECGSLYLQNSAVDERADDSTDSIEEVCESNDEEVHIIECTSEKSVVTDIDKRITTPEDEELNNNERKVVGEVQSNGNNDPKDEIQSQNELWTEIICKNRENDAIDHHSIAEDRDDEGLHVGGEIELGLDAIKENTSKIIK